MSRASIATLFTFILMIVTTAPAILSIVNSDCEIAIFFDASEEEEKKGKESTKDLEIKVFQSYNDDINFINLEQVSISNIYLNSYNSVYRQIFSPPPEQYGFI